MYAYSEKTFGGPTLGYVMTENLIYGCCGLNEDVSDIHLGHTENGHKKKLPTVETFMSWNKTFFIPALICDYGDTTNNCT